MRAPALHSPSGPAPQVCRGWAGRKGRDRKWRHAVLGCVRRRGGGAGAGRRKWCQRWDLSVCVWVLKEPGRPKGRRRRLEEEEEELVGSEAPAVAAEEEREGRKAERRGGTEPAGAAPRSEPSPASVRSGEQAPPQLPHPTPSGRRVAELPGVAAQVCPPERKKADTLHPGTAFLTQTVCLDDTTVKFEIWDTAGQERYHSLAPMYYRGAQAAIVVYDITNEESFARAKNWVKELQRQASPNIVIALSGNKADLASKRAVDFQEAQSYADDNSLLFMETSAKTSMNVNEIFMAIAKKLPKNEPQNPGANSARGRGVDLTEPAQPTRSQCCSN